MRLYHERSENRFGAVGAGDEEECFTALGRRTGVWLTTEPLEGPTVLVTEVEAEVAGPYDVSGNDREHRVFVVPAAVCGAWTFA